MLRSGEGRRGPLEIFGRQEGVVPQINVIAEGLSDAVMHTERINVADFESEHVRVQLVERIAWAVGDADAVEVAHGSERDREA